jgi:hypothetical protein
MATRCRIGMELEDGTIKHSYCHWDGYPTGVGKTLVEHYNDIEKVKELLSFGDMSYLAPEIHPSGETHSFDSSEENVTVFYKRDRGESEVNSVITSMDELFSVQYNFLDYVYLFRDGNWYYTYARKMDWKNLNEIFQDFALTT